MKTAIIYCRVSTDKQAQQGDSIANQEKDCRSYCERMHIDVVEVFHEQFTGTSIQRPALGEVMKFLKKNSGKIDYCIVHKIDRSTRGGLGDYYEIKKQIESSGTTLKDTYGVIGENINVVHVDNLDTSEYDWATFNPSEMAVSMMVLQAQQERAGILRRTIPQEMRNTQNGYISRQAHFGYQNEKICTPEGKLKVVYIPDPIESKWVQTMFELRSTNNYTDLEIVDRINLMGFKSRSQKKWNIQRTNILGEKGGKQLSVKQLQLFIKNPIYAGIMIEKWTGNKPIRGQFQGLVSIDTFNRANHGKIEILEHSNGNVSIVHGEEKLPEKITYKRTRFHSEYPFSRAIKCPHCEGHLTPNKSRSQNGKHHYYYQCTGKFGNKHKTYTVRRDDLNETVIDFLSNIEYDKEVYVLFKHVVEDVWNSEKSTLESQKQDQKENIEKLEIEKDRLLKNIEKFMDFPEILKAKNDELAKISKKNTNSEKYQNQ